MAPQWHRHKSTRLIFSETNFLRAHPEKKIEKLQNRITAIKKQKFIFFFSELFLVYSDPLTCISSIIHFTSDIVTGWLTFRFIYHWWNMLVHPTSFIRKDTFYIAASASRLLSLITSPNYLCFYFLRGTLNLRLAQNSIWYELEYKTGAYAYNPSP